MRQSIDVTRTALARFFTQRCFYLFIFLLALVALAPFIETAPRGALLTSVIDAFIILCAVAAVGRTTLSFVVVLCLAVPTVLFKMMSIDTGESAYYMLSLKLHAAVYVVAIGLLLRYVFDRHVMDADRLWGAASSYLMIGVLGSFLFSIVDRASPGSFAIRGEVRPLDFMEVIYFSFSTLTTSSYGDIVPLTRVARTGSIVEGIVGQLFIAILIAKLVGVYPPPLPERAREVPPP